MNRLRREHIRLLAPASGRRDTLVAALEHLYDECRQENPRRARSPLIVEVGTTRNAEPQGCLADGWATRVFAWFAAECDGRLLSVDPNANAIRRSQVVVPEEQHPHVEWCCAPAEEFLATLDEPIDLLYMDGPHTADHDFSRRIHFSFYRALRAKPSLVLWDDIVDARFRVKGELAIPAMLRDGYSLVFREKRQALLWFCV